MGHSTQFATFYRYYKAWHLYMHSKGRNEMAKLLLDVLGPKIDMEQYHHWKIRNGL